MMPETSWLKQVVEKAVSEVFEGQLARIQSELVARVLQDVEPRVGGSSDGNPASLLQAVSSIHGRNTQREILRTLLDGASRYAGRVALFVIKTGTATGWQARGFSEQDEIKDFSLNIASGLPAKALESRNPATGPADQMDDQFLARFHPPADGRVLLLPLVLKEKVAALVYADSGSQAGGAMDSAALELLVVTTSAWLEVVSLRKHSSKESSADSAAHENAAHDDGDHKKPARAAAPSVSDPFAAHAPAHLSTPTAPVEAHVAVAQESAPVAGMSPQPGPPAAAPSAPAAATAVAMAPDSLASLGVDDAEIHRKAQRFARLLVDEIKLYNQAKVSEGRKNRDLYDRLREDIDKSFATYQKRYGNTVAGGAGYFNGELVRSLAEDDISLMGANFQR
jgi:hypothetical protein